MEQRKNKGGRPAKAVADKMVERSVRLLPAHWIKFAALGGGAWLRAALDTAPMPPEAPKRTEL